MSDNHFQNLTIKNAFLFAAVMEDSSLCASFLSRVLDMEIAEVEVVTEKAISFHPKYHGIRLDVLAEDERKRRFNVEMQVRFEKSLLRRSRYYQSQLDMDALKTGASYGTLPDSYVIFICDYSPFPESLYRYTIKNYCEETRRCAIDGKTLLVLSTRGKNREQIPKSLSDLLDYIGHPEKEDDFADDPLITAIKARVKAIKNDQIMEGRFMMLENMVLYALEEGKEIGIEEGREIGISQGKEIGISQGKEIGISQGKEIGISQGKEIGISQGKEIGISQGKEIGISQGKEIGISQGKEIGIEEGRKRVNHLIKILAERGRIEDMIKTSDPDYLEQLFQEFNL